MFQALIEKLTRHEDLTAEEASAAMTEVMEGRAAASHIAALLIGLAMKGERPEEVVGLARTMRAHAVHVSKRYDNLFDTCGTGGDRSGTFNISSCAALVMAACGVHVAKHGNRSASSRTGGADVYEALGIRITAPPAVVERWLMLLGTTRAWVVHGADGIDELTTTGYTKISECRDGAVNTFYLHPADVGLPKAPAGALQGGDAHENARIIEAILEGKRGPARDVVLLNAGAGLFIAGAASSVDDGILRASRAIDRGDAKRTLARLVSISTAEEFGVGA